MSEPLPATVHIEADHTIPVARPVSRVPLQALALFALLIFAVIFVAANRADIRPALTAARDAQPGYLALALGLTFAYVGAYGGLHWASLRAVRVAMPYPAVLKAATAAQFLNLVVINSGGMGGLPILVRQVERRGGNRSHAAVAYLLSSQLGHFLFGAVLLIALVVAQAKGQATPSEWVAAAIFGAFSVVSLVLLVAAIRSRHAVRRFYAVPWKVRARVSRLLGRGEPPRPDMSNADELREAALIALRRPGALLAPAMFALALEGIGIATLWSTLRSFGVPAGLDAPLVAYAVGVLFGIVGFLPAGLGFTEAGLGVALSAAGVAGPQAALTVITYRVFEVWLPFVLGALALRFAWRKES